MITRRNLLIGGGVVVGAGVVGAVGAYGLVEARVLPGKTRVDALLGGCGEGAVVPDVEAGPIVSGVFQSAARKTEVGWAMAYPPGYGPGSKLPVCVCLHGGDSDHNDILTGISLQYFLADLVTNSNVPPFALAAVDGGAAVNWHKRADGDDPPTMISKELLPLLAKRKIDIGKIGLWGVSLGGYGALRIGMLMGPDRVAAIAASAPAIWANFEETQPGRFDNVQDFKANDLFALKSQLDGIPVMIDGGNSDPFALNVERFRNELTPVPAGAMTPGCHDDKFWTRNATAELAFIGQHLTPR